MSNNRNVEALANRYRDGYRVAKVVIGLGTGVKIIGAVIGGLVLLSSLFGATALSNASGNTRGDATVVLVVFGGILGGGIALVFFAIGVLISSAGQMHLAVLDSAVSVAPMLDDSQRLDIILGSSTGAKTENKTVSYLGGWTCGCGYVNSDRRNCLKCERERPAGRRG